MSPPTDAWLGGNRPGHYDILATNAICAIAIIRLPRTSWVLVSNSATVLFGVCCAPFHIGLVGLSAVRIQDPGLIQNTPQFVSYRTDWSQSVFFLANNTLGK